MKRKLDVRRMTELALLTAIVLIMAFTPLGYLMTPWGVQISFIAIPVAVGCVVLGPGAGAFLGLVFGLTSFFKAFETASGQIMLNVNPLGVFICCVVPRVLVGLLPGLVYQAMRKRAHLRTFGQALCCLLAPLVNTFFYITFNYIFFADTWLDMAAAVGFTGGTGFGLLAFMFGMVAVNGILEAAASLLIGTAVCKALIHALHRNEK